VVEIDKRHVHSLGGFLEEMMVKTTHFSTFVLTLSKELLFGEFESPPIEQLLVFVRSLTDLSLCLDLLEGQPFLFWELLEFNVIEFIVVQEFAEDDVEVGSMLKSLRDAAIWFKEGKKVVGQLGRLEIEQLEVLVTLTHHKIKYKHPSL
jgi:hypothetical protein